MNVLPISRGSGYMCLVYILKCVSRHTGSISRYFPSESRYQKWSPNRFTFPYTQPPLSLCARDIPVCELMRANISGFHVVFAPVMLFLSVGAFIRSYIGERLVQHLGESILFPVPLSWIAMSSVSRQFILANYCKPKFNVLYSSQLIPGANMKVFFIKNIFFLLFCLQFILILIHLHKR